MNALRRTLVVLAVCGAAVACGGSDTDEQTEELLLVVNAPFSDTPYVAETIANGVQLAVRTTGGASPGTFAAGDAVYRIRVVEMDNELSPRQALRNVRRAAADGAVAVVDEGTGVEASWQAAADEGVVIGIVYQGGIDLVDERDRPNVFRIAPTDRGVAFRLAEYLVPKRLKIALLHDDTGYGRRGAAALDRAFSLNPEAVAARIVVPAGQPDVAPQVLRARRAGATALLVWARGPTIANVVAAARSRGWDVPVYTSPAGADPIVRQQLADHPEWVDGLTFASGRLAAESGPASFEAFRGVYEQTFGVDEVGVTTRDGASVIQPPEYAMYAYDFVRLLIAAVGQAGGTADRDALLDAMNEVTIEGANGDERSFNRNSHEGVIDDDVYFARFEDMTYRPVGDDPLSATLPVAGQRSSR